MERQDPMELCVVSFIYRNPFTKLFEGGVDCGKYQDYLDIFSDLKRSGFEVTFNECVSEGDLAKISKSMYAKKMEMEEWVCLEVFRINKEEAIEKSKKQNVIIPVKQNEDYAIKPDFIVYSRPRQYSSKQNPA